MATTDSLNPNFSLPDMGDYYYDAPDQQMFYAELDEALNPLHRPDANETAVAKFYQEDPPNVGAVNDTYTFEVTLGGGGITDGTENVRGINVSDGDTIAIPFSALRAGDEQSDKYLSKLVDEANLAASTVNAPASNAKLSIRFAGMDCKELPHFTKAGIEEFTSEEKGCKIDDIKSDGEYVWSLYQSFMDDPVTIKNPAGKQASGIFYSYSRKLDKANFVKMVDGCWHQYYSRGDDMYVLRKCASNEYNEDTIIDAGIARDVVANVIAQASELRIQIDGTKLSRSADDVVTMFRHKKNDGSVENTVRGYLDMFFDNYTQFTNSGFNYWGLDAYGRAIAVVYAKLGSKWVNLNKMVIADTDDTEVNKYSGGGEGAIDTSGYDFDAKQYADSIYNQSKEMDDRDEVQGKIFGKTLKALKDWTVTIGDVTLFVPPTSIRCLTQTKSQHMPVLRAKGSMAKSATKMQRIIEMDIFFNEDKGINGYKYETNTKKDGTGKAVTYYMNGLRALYAEFRICPFMPITNSYVNEVLGVDAVTMISFSCDTVPNFPKLIKATVQFSEFEYQIYMPEIPRDDGDDDESGELRNYFAEQINYPLLRYYYQRLLMHGDELKNARFLDDKYVTSTFGNRTCLVPMSFKDPYIHFYIPNKEHLDKLKAAKIAKSTSQGNSMEDMSLSAKDRQFAGDLAKLNNELEYLQSGGENNYSTMATLNEFLKNSQYSDLALIVSPSGEMVVRQQVTENGVTSYQETDDCKEVEAQIKDSLSLLNSEYTASLGQVKNSEGQDLFTTGSPCTTVKVDSDDKDKATLSYSVRGTLNTKYMSNDEMKKLKSIGANASNGTYSADEVLPDRSLSVPFSINLQKAKDQDNNYIVSLGQPDADYFYLDKSKDVGFLNAAAAISDKTTDDPNDPAELSKNLNLVTKNTVKFEPYNEAEDYLVESIHINTSNTFSQITLQETTGFAPQYVGGTDISINISMYTKSRQAAASMNILPAISAEYARNYRLVLTAWPLRIESEFTKLFGITDTMVDAVEVDTVPNFPDLYHIQLSLVSVDRTLRNREAMKKKDMKNFHNLSVEGVAAERTWNYDQMNQYLSQAELYPDLELPTIQELSDAGFNFIRYSNEDRIYPDPDFYFTYSYVLVSQVIREAVLNGLNSSAAEIDMRDSMGHRMNGKLDTSMSQWQKNYEPDTAAEINELFRDDEERAVAHFITDFSNASHKNRDEVWTIAPNVKVAFAEKRIVNHLNDRAKQDDQKAHGGTPLYASNPTNPGELASVPIKKSAASQDANGQQTTKTASNDEQATADQSSEQTQDAGQTDTSQATDSDNSENDSSIAGEPKGDGSGKETAAQSAYNEMVAKKYHEYTKTVCKALDDVIMGTDVDAINVTDVTRKLYDALGEADFAPYADQDGNPSNSDSNSEAVSGNNSTAIKTNTTAKSTSAVSTEDKAKADMKDSEQSAEESGEMGITESNSTAPWTSGMMDKWLDAAADAFCSNGNCDYSPDLDADANLTEGVGKAIGGVVGGVVGGAAGAIGGAVGAGALGAAGAAGGAAIGGKIADTVTGADMDSRPWRYKHDWRAKIAYGEGDVRMSFHKKGSSEDGGDKAWLKLAKYNSVQFGYFDFRFYSEDELSSRFGELYGTVSESARANNRFGAYLADPWYRDQDRSVQNDYVERCITDYDFAKKAFYRICLVYLRVMISYDILPSFSYDVFRGALKNKENMEKVLKKIQQRRDEKAQKEKLASETGKTKAASPKWKQKKAATASKKAEEAKKDAEKAKKDYEDAQKKYDEAKQKADESGSDEDKKKLESLNKDVEKAKKAAEDKQKAAEKAAKEASDAANKKETIDMNAKSQAEDLNGVADNGMRASVQASKDQQKAQKDASAENAASAAASTVNEYTKLFKKNQGAVDNGKTFIMILMGVLDGDPEFTKLLMDRRYDSLKNITHSCMSGQSSPVLVNDDVKSYTGKARSFIRALAGEKVIDEAKIGAGESQDPNAVFSQFNGRRNIAAAADDPSKYLVHSFYDMVVHDCRGRMLRAFPTFYLILIDEGRKIGRWKLHDNFYNVNSIASITVSKSRKMPTDTAEIVMSNFFNTFTDNDENLNNNYTANYTDVFRSIWLPTLESYAVDQDRKRTEAGDPERFRIRPGARVHIRFGYGADASALPTTFNGVVAECEVSDTVTLVCQSDGVEICKPVLIDKEAYELPGMDEAICTSRWGTSGATPKQILEALLTYKGGPINSYLHKKNLDDAANQVGTPMCPLGIYHFGNPDINYAGEPEPMQNILEIGVTKPQDRYVKPHEKGMGEKAEDVVVAGAKGSVEGAQTGAEIGSKVAGGVGAAVGGVIGSVGGGLTDTVDAMFPKEPPQLNFEVFGKTVWDILNIVKSVDPSYYAAVVPFHLRSSIFMGRGHDYYAYDYENAGGQWIEKRKPYQQAHIYDSCTDIINNTMKVSTKDIKTCAVGMYEVSGAMNAKVQKKTDPQWVDANIYPEYQKTMYVDTKLFGEPSRHMGVLSDALNFVAGGVTNSTLDRALGASGFGENHHETAVKMTVDALKTQMKEMYAGQMTIIGDPTVKPNDRLVLNDSYDSICGQCLVRDVVQVFTADAGYKTVITPDVITAEVGQDAADEQKVMNFGVIALNAAVACLATCFMQGVMEKSANKLTDIMSSKYVQMGASKAKSIGRTIGNKGINSLKNIKNKSMLSGLAKSMGAAKDMIKGTEAASKIGKAMSAGGKVLSGLKNGGMALWKAKSFLGRTPVTFGITVALGGVEDFISSKIDSRKRLVIFPLMKYNKPMVGGIDGNVGTVYGAPNFNSEENSLWSTLGGLAKRMTPWTQKGFTLVDTLMGNKQQEQMDRMTQIANTDEGKAQLAYRKVNRSQLEYFRNAYFNPAKTRLEVRKESSIKYAQKIYAVAANSQDTINTDPNFLNKMKPVIGDRRLKDYMDLGFFRVAAHERGFTSDISDKVHCMYLKDSESGNYVPVNAIVDGNGTVDIPYLAADARGVLCEIVKRSFNYMAGTEQARDAAKWYKDNGGSFITLTSALKCGSEKNYEATGFSFVLTASDGKSLKALQASTDHLNEMMKKGHEKTDQVPEDIIDVKTTGQEVFVVVHPPEDVS